MAVTPQSALCGCNRHARVVRAHVRVLAGLLLGVGLSPALAKPDKPPTVRPILEYVIDQADGSYTAWFGYENPGLADVHVPVGKDNRFTPHAADRGQPTVFRPGRHQAVFRVGFAHGALTWHLGNQVATAVQNRAGVVLGRNQPPIVRLTAPADGAAFTAPATIALTAAASDPDGTIARVAFFAGDTLLGEVTAAPYTLAWSPAGGSVYSLRASATDNAGATVFSAAVQVTVGVSTALPLIANFEAAEGYAIGDLNGQQGWTVVGDAQIVAAPVFAGGQALQLAPGTPPAAAERALATAGIVYHDFFLRPAAGPTAEASARWRSPIAGVTVVRRDDRGVVQLLAGDALGGAHWRDATVTVPLDAAGVGDWQRFTVREDHGARTWDFYADGAMRAADLPFAEAAAEGNPGLRLIGHATAPAGFDDLLAATENPLFFDVDNDGMEDAWETAQGLDPARDDRDEDADADGLTNLVEYILGTDPTRADTDGDGMPDGWEAAHGSDPAVDDAGNDLDGDGVDNLTEYRQGRHPLRGAIADVAGLVSLRVFQPGT